MFPWEKSDAKSRFFLQEVARIVILFNNGEQDQKDCSRLVVKVLNVVKL